MCGASVLEALCEGDWIHDVGVVVIENLGRKSKFNACKEVFKCQKYNGMSFLLMA